MISVLVFLILLALLYVLIDIASNIQNQTKAIYSLIVDLKSSSEQLESIKDSIIYIHPDILEINYSAKNVCEAIEKNHKQTIEVLCDISLQISSTKDEVEKIYLSR